MTPPSPRPDRRGARFRRAGVGVILALTGCDHPDASTCAENGLTYENFGLGFTATYCRSCHSAVTPDRRGAPDGTDFDNESEVVDLASSIRRTVLDDGTMPIGGGVQPVDLERLDAWLTCIE